MNITKVNFLILILSRPILGSAASVEKIEHGSRNQNKLRGLTGVIKPSSHAEEQDWSLEADVEQIAGTTDANMDELDQNPSLLRALKDQLENNERELQNYVYACNSNAQCQQYGGAYRYCNGFTCYNPYKCGISCNMDNNCHMAYDGCSYCINNTCQRSSGGSNNRNAYYGNPNTYYGNRNNNSNNQCGRPCSYQDECIRWAGPCTRCSVNGVGEAGYCYDPYNLGGGSDPYNNRNIVGNSRTCVATYEALKTALQDTQPGAVQICSGANIVLDDRITVNINNKILQCQGAPGTCTISRESGGRKHGLLEITADDVSINGVVFQGGYTNWKGGAIYARGSDVRINNCQFNSNYASQAGGAVSMRSGTIVDSRGSGNYASQCMDVYNELTGSCSTLSV